MMARLIVKYEQISPDPLRLCRVVVLGSKQPRTTRPGLHSSFQRRSCPTERAINGGECQRAWLVREVLPRGRRQG